MSEAAMNIESVLARFQGLHREGKGWKALCPAHPDKHPSLSIKFENGRLLFHCFSGCTYEAVLHAAGVEPSELVIASHPRQIQAEYNYKNVTGELIFQVVRYEPKGFLQRRPDGKGAWLWNISGVVPVLYRLPDLVSAESVLVVEGEKDCEAAFGLGFIATCNPGGAGRWREEYSECLRGKQVAIIADADERGRKHAQQVAVSLNGKAKSLKLLELPEAKDLSEYLDRGGTRESLVHLIETARPWTTLLDQSSGKFRLTSLADLMSEPEEQVTWLLADRLPAAGVSVVSAKPKVGKSTFVRCLALAVARGSVFLGGETSPGTVIYLALEEKRSEVRAHFSDLGATGDEPIFIHCAAAPQDAVTELCRLAKERKPVLIVVDPLFKFLRVRDEKAYAEVCAAIEPLLSVARDTGAHVMLVHHNGKLDRPEATDAILGSTAIFGGVDSAIILKRYERYRTIQSAQRYGKDLVETTLRFDPETRSLSLGDDKADVETSRITEQILEYLGEGEELRTRAEIEDHIEGRTTHKRAALKKLCATGRILQSGTGAKGDPYRYQTGKPAGFVDSCSSLYMGTREQELEHQSASKGAEHAPLGTRNSIDQR